MQKRNNRVVANLTDSQSKMEEVKQESNQMKEKLQDLQFQLDIKCAEFDLNEKMKQRMTEENKRLLQQTQKQQTLFENLQNMHQNIEEEKENEIEKLMKERKKISQDLVEIKKENEKNNYI